MINKLFKLALCAAVLCLNATRVFAAEATSQSVSATTPELLLTRVAENVYSAIGATAPPTYENGGHNNNLSVVIGRDAVLVVNGGASYQLAKALHQAIKKITDKPVKWLVDENGQGHAFLGNSYWAQLGGVEIIAQAEAADEILRHGDKILQDMLAYNRDKGEGTFVAPPTQTFSDILQIDLGDMPVQVISFGPAHSPGDISVWLPNQKIMITGDIAFHQRLLGIFPDTVTSQWIQSFEKMAALEPLIVIPGHGAPTDMAAIERETLGYLKFLRAEVIRILESEGDLQDAYNIDQSAYSHLDTFEELAAKNAGRVFQELEADYF